MKYDLEQQLKNSDGTLAETAGVPETARKGIIAALLNDPQGTQAADKAKKFELFLKLKGSGDDFSVDEVALMSKAIEIYPTLVYGQLKAILDQRAFTI
jgi:hypothetical protein